MGDKGGKKNISKSQKQLANKKVQETQKKQDKQKKDSPSKK